MRWPIPARWWSFRRQARAARSRCCRRFTWQWSRNRAFRSEVQLGITQADYALADTGTLVVFSEAGEGRTLSLLPPVHVAVVEESRILAGLDERSEEHTSELQS